MLHQKGQVLLAVVLIIVVTSTIGLSLASRTITSFKSSTEEVESQKALSAAEAGIERSIQGNVPEGIVTTSLANNSSYSTTATAIQSSIFLINGGNTIPKDEGADVWFVNHKADKTPDYATLSSAPLSYFHLYWKSPAGAPVDDCLVSSSAPAAIEAIVVTNTAGVVKTSKYVYDSCSRGNNFTTAESGTYNELKSATGLVFKNRTPEGGANDLAKGLSNIVFMRVIPLYKEAVIGVFACKRDGSSCVVPPLPSQGYIINSLGTSGQASHKLTYFEGYPQTYLPYLSYGLFVAK